MMTAPTIFLSLKYDTVWHNENQSVDKSERISQHKAAFSQIHDVHNVCKGYMNADVRTKIAEYFASSDWMCEIKASTCIRITLSHFLSMGPLEPKLRGHRHVPLSTQYSGSSHGDFLLKLYFTGPSMSPCYGARRRRVCDAVLNNYVAQSTYRN